MNVTGLDVISHVVTSMDNDGSNHYVDHLNYQWSVYIEDDAIRVEIRNMNEPGDELKVFKLVPVSV